MKRRRDLALIRPVAVVVLKPRHLLKIIFIFSIHGNYVADFGKMLIKTVVKRII